ncbi:MAG: hypothetical protein ACT4P1_03220 [Sporichthyaceae bacterium]
MSHPPTTSSEAVPRPPAGRSASPGTRGSLALSLATAAAAVPGVERLCAGPGVPAVTHYPGGTVTGIVLGTDRAEVHLVAARLPLAPVVDAVHAAVRAALAAQDSSLPVQVYVEDVVLGDPVRPTPRRLPTAERAP